MLSVEHVESERAISIPCRRDESGAWPGSFDGRFRLAEHRCGLEPGCSGSHLWDLPLSGGFFFKTLIGDWPILCCIRYTRTWSSEARRQELVLLFQHVGIRLPPLVSFPAEWSQQPARAALPCHPVTINPAWCQWKAINVVFLRS